MTKVVAGMVAIGGLVRGSGIGGGQQRTSLFQAAVDVARGHKAKVANLDEAAGQIVLKKSSDEFGRRQGGGVAVAVRKATALSSMLT